MWARICEIFFGTWLILSPWMLSLPSYFTEVSCGAGVIMCSLISFHPKARKTHLINILLGVILILLGIHATFYPAQQNYLIISLLLLLFGIVPSKAFDNPSSWESFLKNKNPPF